LDWSVAGNKYEITHEINIEKQVTKIEKGERGERVYNPCQSDGVCLSIF
jgi:hypothetical protein